MLEAKERLERRMTLDGIDVIRDIEFFYEVKEDEV